MGITFSAPEDLRQWSDENGLTGDLLFDADRSVAMAYGAAESAGQERATRMSFLVGPDGTIQRIYEAPEATPHPGEALADLG